MNNMWIRILQHTATHCYTLLHTATHCYTLVHTATHLLHHHVDSHLHHMRIEMKRNSIERHNLSANKLWYSWIRRHQFMCATWLIHMCNMTRSYTWDMTHSQICDMTHSPVRHDAFIGASWLIHTCNMTQLYACKKMMKFDRACHLICKERWGAGVEYHFQEISWNLRPVVNGT